MKLAKQVTAHEQKLYAVTCLTLICNAFDGWATWLCIHNHGIDAELNPIMRMFLIEGPRTFFGVKMLAGTALILGVAYCVADQRSSFKMNSLWLLFVAFGTLSLIHLHRLLVL